MLISNVLTVDLQRDTVGQVGRLVPPHMVFRHGVQVWAVRSLVLADQKLMRKRKKKKG